jgi:hypothetical protein
MKTSLIALFVLCFSLVGCAHATQCEQPGGLGLAGEPDTTFEQDIRQLMDMTNALELGKQVGGALVTALGTQYPQVPAEFWKKLSDELTTDRFLKVMIPVYQKHLTQAEVRAMIRFYQTPEGASVIAKLPALTQESMAMGAALGQELAQEFVGRARATGYKI